jgi:translation initiation factor 2 subunit 1
VPDELANAFAEVARERIHVPMVKVKGIVEVRCNKPHGVKIIKEAFSSAKKAEKSRDTKLRFYVIAAPKYCLEILADNYKRAEDVLQKVAQDIVANIDKAGGHGTFRREK